MSRSCSPPVDPGGAGIPRRKSSLDNGVTPRLPVSLVGNDPASAIYVSNKERACVHRLEAAAEPKREGQQICMEILRVLDALRACRVHTSWPRSMRPRYQRSYARSAIAESLG